MTCFIRTVVATSITLSLLGSATQVAAVGGHATTQVGDNTIPAPVTLAHQSDPLIQIQAFTNPATASPEAIAPAEEEHSEFTTGSSVLNVPRGLLGQLVDLVTKVFNALRGVTSG